MKAGNLCGPSVHALNLFTLWFCLVQNQREMIG